MTPSARVKETELLWFDQIKTLKLLFMRDEEEILRYTNTLFSEEKKKLGLFLSDVVRFLLDLAPPLGDSGGMC